MTHDEFRQRVAEVAAETAAPPGSWWWLSFADPDRPEGEHFLGACYVEAENLPLAITVSHARGINPGGQVATWGPFPLEAVPPEEYRHRLLSRAEIDEMDALLEEGPST